MEFVKNMKNGVIVIFHRHRLKIDFWRNNTMQLQVWGVKEIRNNSKIVHRQCPICGEDNENIVLMAPVYDFVSCKKCGLVYVKYVLNEKEIDDFYKDNEIYQSAWSKEYEDVVKNKGVSTHKSIVRNILDYREGDDKLLDVGCAFGKLLYELKSHFKKVEGVELNVRTSKMGKKMFDIPIYTKKLEELNLPNSSYDAIILNQVIEHLNDVDSLFKKFYRILKPGGILYIGCPNMDSLSMKLFKGEHVHVSLHAHVNMFNNKSIIFLANKVGFKIKKVETNNMLDIKLIDILYFYFNRKKFLHRYNYNIILTPISYFVQKITQYVLEKSNLLKKWGKGSYLEVVLER